MATTISIHTPQGIFELLSASDEVAIREKVLL